MYNIKIIKILHLFKIDSLNIFYLFIFKYSIYFNYYISLQKYMDFKYNNKISMELKAQINQKLNNTVRLNTNYKSKFNPKKPIAMINNTHIFNI